MNAYEHLRLDYLRLVAFANMILDPEKYGHAVTPEVRDAAREALGLTKVEVRQTKGAKTGEEINKDQEVNEVVGDGYLLTMAPDGREFYMCGKRMFSCMGYRRSVVNGETSYSAGDFREYSHWREMADDMENSGIDNIFAPFSLDWG